MTARTIKILLMSSAVYLLTATSVITRSVLTQNCTFETGSCGFTFEPPTRNGLYEWDSLGKRLDQIRGNNGFKLIPNRPDLPFEKERHVMTIELGSSSAFHNEVGIRTAVSPGLDGTDFCVKFWYFLRNLGDDDARLQFDTTDPSLEEYGRHTFTAGLWEQKRIIISRYPTATPLHIKLVAHVAYNPGQRYNRALYHLVIDEWSFKNESCAEEDTLIHAAGQNESAMSRLRTLKNTKKLDEFGDKNKLPDRRYLGENVTAISLDVLPGRLTWSHTEELCCDFDKEKQNHTDRFITACPRWVRQTPMFDYSFWIVNYSESSDNNDLTTTSFLTGLAYAISKCDKKLPPVAGVTPASDRAVASLQSTEYVPRNTPTYFRVTFWCYFNNDPSISDNENSHFYLELSLYYTNNGPQRNVWGKRPSDYDKVKAHRWNLIVVDFSESERFVYTFLAYHSKNCQNTTENIIIDSLDTRTGVQTCVETTALSESSTMGTSIEELASNTLEFESTNELTKITSTLFSADTEEGAEYTAITTLASTIDEMTSNTTIMQAEMTDDSTAENSTDRTSEELPKSSTTTLFSVTETDEKFTDSTTVRQVLSGSTTVFATVPSEPTSNTTAATSTVTTVLEDMTTVMLATFVTRPPNPCLGKKCGVGGKCVPKGTSFRCQCLPDFVQSSATSACYCPVGKFCFY